MIDTQGNTIGSISRWFIPMRFLRLPVLRAAAVTPVTPMFSTLYAVEGRDAYNHTLTRDPGIHTLSAQGVIDTSVAVPRIAEHPETFTFDSVQLDDGILGFDGAFKLLSFDGGVRQMPTGLQRPLMRFAFDPPIACAEGQLDGGRGVSCVDVDTGVVSRSVAIGFGAGWQGNNWYDGDLEFYPQPRKLAVYDGHAIIVQVMEPYSVERIDLQTGEQVVIGQGDAKSEVAASSAGIFWTMPGSVPASVVRWTSPGQVETTGELGPVEQLVASADGAFWVERRATPGDTTPGGSTRLIRALRVVSPAP